MFLTRAGCFLAAIAAMPVLSGCVCSSAGTPTPTPIPSQITLINQALTVSVARVADNSNPPLFLESMTIGPVYSFLTAVAGKPISITVTAPPDNSANIRATVGGEIFIQPAGAVTTTQLVFTPSTTQVLQVTISGINPAAAGQQFGVIAVQ